MALQLQIGNMLDSITCTTVPCDIHQWYNDILSSVEHGSKQPQGADIKVPDASSNYENFISIGLKKSILMGMHGHGFCCEMGKRPNNALIGQFIHQHPMGPIMWEQTRYEQDAY
jgi:hypothetical protein